MNIFLAVKGVDGVIGIGKASAAEIGNQCPGSLIAALIFAVNGGYLFMTEDDEQYTKAVHTSAQFPVREIKDIYAHDEIMHKYSHFTKFLGDYYQITPGWGEARSSWWNMLQDVGEGKDIPAAVKEFTAAANAGAQADAVEIID